MQQKENTPTICYIHSSDFDTYLRERNIYSSGPGRAIGISYKNGEQEIVIDDQYYREHGIDESFLPAILLHEQVELNDTSCDAHIHALHAEYSYLMTTLGFQACLDYHNQIQLLYGNLDENREKVFQQILLEQHSSSVINSN